MATVADVLVVGARLAGSPVELGRRVGAGRRVALAGGRGRALRQDPGPPGTQVDAARSAAITTRVLAGPRALDLPPDPRQPVPHGRQGTQHGPGHQEGDGQAPQPTPATPPPSSSPATGGKRPGSRTTDKKRPSSRCIARSRTGSLSRWRAQPTRSPVRFPGRTRAGTARSGTGSPGGGA
jgi:hypothetical protein